MKNQKWVDPSSIGLDVTGISSEEVYCRCPFHGDDATPSAEFNMASGMFYCFACHVTCSAEDLALQLGGTVERVLPGYVKKSTKEEQEWRQYILAPLALKDSYLADRGVSDSQVREFGVRRAGKRIVFVCRAMDGNPSGVVLRRTDGGRPRYQKLGKCVLWPLELLVNSGPSVLIVEGPFGVIRARQAKLEAFAMCGSSPSVHVVRVLNGRQVTGFLDDDLAGKVGAVKLALSCHARIVLPGGEVDEMTVEKISGKVKRATRDIGSLTIDEELHNKLKFILRKRNKIVKKQTNSSRW